MKLVSLPQEAAAQVAAVSDGALRAGPFVGIPQLLRDLGQDPTAVFAAAGCDLHVLDHSENTVSFTVVGRLVDACVQATECPHFGLLLGEQNSPECLGLVGLLAQHSPTLKHALRNIVLHLHLHDRGAVPTLSVADGKATLGYIVYQPRVSATAQLYDIAAAVGYNILHTLCGPAWRPLSVLLPHAEPNDSAPYRRVFGITPSFDAEQTALVFSSDWLERPLPGADPALYQALQDRVTELSVTVSGDLPSRVRRIACNLLRCGTASRESAAEVLSMHPRSLDRRLQQLGTSYRQLREECAQALACHLLLETDLPIAEIAARLHYANAPAFTRAFQRWTGSAPAAWRAARRRG